MKEQEQPFGLPGRPIPDPAKLYIFGNDKTAQHIRRKIEGGERFMLPQRKDIEPKGRPATEGEAFNQIGANVDGFVLCPGTRAFDFFGLIDEITVGSTAHSHRLLEPQKAEELVQRSGRIGSHITRFFEVEKEKTEEGKPRSETPRITREIDHRVGKPVVLLGHEEAWSPYFRILKDLKEQQLLRFEPERYLYRTEKPSEALDKIHEDLTIAKRGRHLRYHRHTQTQNFLRQSGGLPPLVNMAISYFGSASTKNPLFLAAAQEMAAFAGKEDKEHGKARWDMVHGGGTEGVMGALTDYSKEHYPDVHVTGITVLPRYGALAIGLERPASRYSPDMLYSAKDMATRMQEFGKQSFATVLMPGGVGSVHELLQVAHDRLNHQAHTLYRTVDHKKVKKPLVLVNLQVKEDGSRLWDSLIGYLKSHEKDVLAEITVVNSVKEAGEYLQQFFVDHQPDLQPQHHHMASPRIRFKAMKLEPPFRADTIRDYSPGNGGNHERATGSINGASKSGSHHARQLLETDAAGRGGDGVYRSRPGVGGR